MLTSLCLKQKKKKGVINKTVENCCSVSRGLKFSFVNNDLVSDPSNPLLFISLRGNRDGTCDIDG